jgi:antitoxin component of RelBE/YafQ-DinJ toxin-antitoxin module
MHTQSVQIKTTLPVQLVDFLQAKADRFGMNLSAFVRHVLVKEVEEEEFPVFQASKMVEESYKKAMEEVKNGQFIEVSSRKELDKYFKSLSA